MTSMAEHIPKDEWAIKNQYHEQLHKHKKISVPLPNWPPSHRPLYVTCLQDWPSVGFPHPPYSGFLYLVRERACHGGRMRESSYDLNGSEWKLKTYLMPTDKCMLNGT